MRLCTHWRKDWEGLRNGRVALSQTFDCRMLLKCDDTRAETRFRLSAKRTSPFKTARGSVQSTTGSRGVRISGSNAGYNMSRGSVKGTGYPLHSPVSPSFPIPCVTVCHHISTGLCCTAEQQSKSLVMTVGISTEPCREGFLTKTMYPILISFLPAN